MELDNDYKGKYKKMIVMGDDNCPLCDEQFEYFRSEFETDTYSCKNHKYTISGSEWKNIKNKQKIQQIKLLKEIFEKRLEEQKTFHKGFLDDYRKDMQGISKKQKDDAIGISEQIITNYEALLKEVSL